MRSKPTTPIEQRDDTLNNARISIYTDEAVQREMWRCHRHGAATEALARRDGLDVARARILLARGRYQRIKSWPLAPVPNDDFQRATAAREQSIIAPTPVATKWSPRISPPPGLTPYLKSLYEVSLLTRDQETHLFRKMNYLKYKASKILTRLDPECPAERLMDQIEQLYEQSIVAKNAIIRANLRLVVAMSKRYAHSTKPFLELVSDGNISLIRAVEKFDYARGFRFSTYATCAIIKNFTQALSIERRDHTRFRNAGDEVFLTAPDQRTNLRADETAQIRRVVVIARLLERLDDRERLIIRHRYGLDAGHEPMTLQQVGDELSVSKERIRQLAKRAIGKLRQAAVEQGIDAPEDCLACEPKL